DNTEMARETVLSAMKRIAGATIRWPRRNRTIVVGLSALVLYALTTGCLMKFLGVCPRLAWGVSRDSRLFGFSPNGKWIATYSPSDRNERPAGPIRIWDAATGRQQADCHLPDKFREFPALLDKHVIAFSVDSRRLSVWLPARYQDRLDRHD